LSGEAVCNSTCLIALERIGQRELLPRVFPTVYAPAAVREEVGVAIPWLTSNEVSNLSTGTVLKMQLGDGEAQAIALALEVPGVEVILDDKKARRIARQLGLRVIGTVGILLRAKRMGVVPAIRPLLQALQTAGFRLSPALLQEALRIAGE
jgi:predicted nucleic acid-binding protein